MYILLCSWRDTPGNLNSMLSSESYTFCAFNEAAQTRRVVSSGPCHKSRCRCWLATVMGSESGLHSIPWNPSSGCARQARRTLPSQSSEFPKECSQNSVIARRNVWGLISNSGSLKKPHKDSMIVYSAKKVAHTEYWITHYWVLNYSIEYSYYALNYSIELLNYSLTLAHGRAAHTVLPFSWSRLHLEHDKLGRQLSVAIKKGSLFVRNGRVKSLCLVHGLQDDTLESVARRFSTSSTLLAKVPWLSSRVI